MYQKFKYILIGTIIFLIAIIVITLDASSRYSAKNKDLEKQSKTLSPEQIQSLQNASQTFNNNKEDKLQDEQSSLTQEEQDELLKKQFEEKKAQLPTNLQQNMPNDDEIVTDSEQKEITEVTENKVQSKGHIEDASGNTLKNYTLQTTFKVNDDEYAIVTCNNQYESNSQYTGRKFYIYKKIDDKLFRSNYIFEHSEILTQDGKSPNLNVKTTPNDIIIEYTSNTRIVRKFDKSLLKNNYKQYLSSPQLKYKEEDSNNKDQSN